MTGVILRCAGNPIAERYFSNIKPLNLELIVTA